MTRYYDDSDFMDPRMLSQGDNFSNQPQFDDYRMAPVGRVASYQSTGWDNGGNIGARVINGAIDGFVNGTMYNSMRQNQMALSMDFGYGNGNFSRPTWDGGYAWSGNGGRRHAYEQEMQRELYMRATTPRWSNQQDQGWYLPQSRGLRSVSGYDPMYDDGYEIGPQRMGPTYRPLRNPNDIDYETQRYVSRNFTHDDYVGNSEEYWDEVPVQPMRRDLPQGRVAQSERFDDNVSQNRIDGSAYDQAVYDRLVDQANALSGHSIQEFDKSVPVRLGCARAVSLLVNKGYGFPVTDQSIRNLEQTLRKANFTEVSIADMKPGDVICGYRAEGDYPHGAVYMGNGKIFNNDSDDGVMEIQSIAKYNKGDFKRFVILRRPEDVPAIARNSVSEGPVRTASGQPIRRDLPQSQRNSQDYDDQYWDG